MLQFELRIEFSPFLSGLQPRDGQLLSHASGMIVSQWQHLLAKMKKRDPARYRKWRALKRPRCHPLLYVRTGAIEPWERLR
jgi:hypothetical protein